MSSYKIHILKGFLVLIYYDLLTKVNFLSELLELVTIQYILKIQIRLHNNFGLNVAPFYTVL